MIDVFTASEVSRKVPHAVADVGILPIITDLTLAPLPIAVTLPPVLSITVPPIVPVVTLPPVLAPVLSAVTLPPVLAITIPPVPAVAPTVASLLPVLTDLTIPPVPAVAPTVASLVPILTSLTLPPVLAITLPPVPPLAPEMYLMLVTQELYGITSSVFKSALENEEALQAAVAGCFRNISSAAVSIISCIESTTQTVTSDASVDTEAVTVPHLRRRRTQDLNAVTVDYTILYDIAARGFSGDPQGGYDDMVAQLMLAVNGTLFNSQLVDNALALNAPDMGGVTAGPVMATSYQPAASGDDDNSSSGSSKHLSKRDKLIIGIVVGIIGLLIICCIISAIFWWLEIVCCCY